MSAGPSIAVLCSGPSLSGFLAAPVPHDFYVGVNRAVVAHPCDYWAFHDAEAFNSLEPIGRPVCFTRKAAFERIAPRERVAEFRWLFHGEINTNCPTSPGWTQFTVTEALVLCEYLHAQCVTVYGCDQAGIDDFDGPPPTPATRTVARWNNERHKFGHVAAWLESCGIEVARGRPVGREAAA